MRRAGGIVAVLFLLAGAFATGLTLLGRVPEQAPPAVDVSPASRERPPRAIDEVRRELVRSYYRSIPRAVLAQATVADIIEALGDPYTEYLTAREYDALKNRTARSYSGVGLTVGRAKGGLIVTSALQGPARDAGIRRGDVIVSIDGRPANKLSFERSLSLIKGEEGTVVRLTVKRPRAGTMRFTVVRQEIAVPAIRSRLITTRKTKIGYARLLSFPASAAERLERATGSLVERGAKGLILDLRDNPGGLLAQAVQAVSIYLESGIVCAVEGARQERRVYEVSGSATHPELPLVLLVNGGSASAAEIVAAALGEHGRSIVVGERTYGKASVQSIKLLSNGAALKLTTATYVTPFGADIRKGVHPDVQAADDPLTVPDEAVVVAEKVLLRHLRVLRAGLPAKAKLLS